MEICNEETKIYLMRRDQKHRQEVITHLSDGECCNDEIKVFVLYNDKDRKYVNNMEKELAHKKIVLTKGLDEASVPYGKKKDIIDHYDYVAVIVSKSFFEDLEVLDILSAIYKKEKKNRKIVPIIQWKDLYEPEKRIEVIETLKDRIDGYREKNMDMKENFDLDGRVSKELRKMQRILKMLQDFIYFAVERDIKTNLPGSDKLLKHILYISGTDVAEREGCVEKGAVIQNQIINVNNGGQFNMAKDNATINTILNGEPKKEK